MAQNTGLQAMMAYWERQHPVNAVQISEISRQLSPQALQAAVDRLFAKYKAASSTSDSATSLTSGDFSHGTVSARFQILPSGSRHPLEPLITDLLNRPFSDDEPPFRVGLAQSFDTQYVWLSYRHSIADARSIALLMQNLLEELAWDQARVLPIILDPKTHSLAEMFPQETRRMGWLSLAGSALKEMRSLIRCRRRQSTNSKELRMSFQVHAEQLPLHVLQDRVRQQNVTVGELMIAAMLEWFLNEDQSQRWSPHRCVSVLVDLTRRAEPKQTHRFGQYIAPLNITANNRHEQTFDELVKHVSQTVRQSDTVSKHLRTLHSLAVNSFVMCHFPQTVANWFQRNMFPVSGALSNVSLSAWLPAPRTPLPVVNYFRGTCATQCAPMILCITTMKHTCTLTSTHHDAVYSDEEMRAFGRHILNRVFGQVESDGFSSVPQRKAA